MDTSPAIVAGIQIGNVVLLLLWLVLSLVALFGLRRRQTLSPGIQIGWALIILLIPIFGAIAFFIVVPAEPKQP